MQQTNDYYKILQVHYQAEPEIIESAYKRLARKYHPDVRPGNDNDDRMQLINEAYSILSDPEKRKEYTRLWENRNLRPAPQAGAQTASAGAKSPSSNAKASQFAAGAASGDRQAKGDMRFLSAKALLEQYFRHIMKNEYSKCYDMISDTDKRNITRDDFIHWQTAVSKVYTMKEFKCDLYGVYKNKMLQGKSFSDVLEFSVNTVEYNIVMDMPQKDSLTKLIILEKEQWRVYLGYEKLEPMINKFNDLRGLLNAKTALDELMENHIRIDSTTGLTNQRGLLENIEREIARHNRYGNPFSLLLCEITLVKLVNPQEEQEVVNRVAKSMGELLISHLRKLDLVGRWDAQHLLVVLPETGLVPAIKVTHKLQKYLKDNMELITDKSCKIMLDFGTTEYHASLEETLDRIYNQLM
ncbi:diguanylate cyclase (GGDEF)-like protein [Anaerotaenia torta]|uniref:DnaJ domain-containing protein n=1 Tax=Anaerotaenia torta TaxID=433293 RepID=UPI003D1C05A8